MLRQSHTDFTNPNFGVYYDANGQVMAVYNVTMETANNTALLLEQNIYGASLLGTKRPNELIYDNGVIPPVTTQIYQNTLGLRNYEVSNHIGNINAIITDRKTYAGIGAPSLYEAVVTMTADYFPGGFLMTSRNTNTNTSRRLYNGMEQDMEVSGNGNSYTTEFRQYDPRLMRWKSLDPLMSAFPWMSPYVAFDNNPVYYTDPLGLQSEDWVKRTVKDEDGNDKINKRGNKISQWEWDPNVTSEEQAMKMEGVTGYSDGKTNNQYIGGADNEYLVTLNSDGSHDVSFIDPEMSLPTSSVTPIVRDAGYLTEELGKGPITNPGAGVFLIGDGKEFDEAFGRTEDWEQFTGIIHSAVMMALSVAGGEALMGLSYVSNGGKVVNLVDDAAQGGKELFNFSTKAAKHMANPGRAVPVQIIEQAIKGSKGVLDPRGSRALMHTIEMIKNGKTYNLEVLYDKVTNSIWHFKYSPIKP